MGHAERLDVSRTIIHIDLDAFYASVVEHENPSLKSVPLIIQQKQIVCTCNYKAREKGIYKLQLMTDALRTCPEAVVVLGEDLTRFRDASKLIYNFLRSRIWSDRAERLGFDEVFLDVSDMIDFNLELLNQNDMANSFFCLDKHDPTAGFSFDGTAPFGSTLPSKTASEGYDGATLSEADLRLRLILGSHLARHFRHELESQHGYTATVGISCTKVAAKLVGNVNKPRNQTTLMPPYEPVGSAVSNLTLFMDGHDIGKVPGVGFKLAQKIRAKVLGRPAAIDEGLVYGGTKEAISVGDVRQFPGLGPEQLEDILGGPGTPKGIGGKVWSLLLGVDDEEVKKARNVPQTLSQEDSYMRYLQTFEQVRHQLILLSRRLVNRMRVDLTEDDEDADEGSPGRRWLAYPKTIRLSTRPRPPTGADGERPRTFHRISKSAPLPSFVFSLNEHSDALADKLVSETLIPLFRSLHQDKTGGSGWNLSLINIACTNMVDTAFGSKESGRDIANMFRRQEEVLKDFRVTESPSRESNGEPSWDSDDENEDDAEVEVYTCSMCQATMPAFVRDAHILYHQHEA
jgi:DNA polymerase iota